MFGLTANAICVFIRSTEEVRYRHQQRGQAGQQGSASDEPRPVDPAPEETHKHDENRVSYLQSQTRVPDQWFHNRSQVLKRVEMRTDFVECSQEAGLPAGEAVASLDGGDGTLHVA